MKVIKSEEGKLSYGRFTKRSQRIANLLMIPVTIVTIIFEFVLYNLLDSWLLSILLSIIVLIILSLIISYNCNFLQKALNKYYKDFDFVSFETTIQLYLKEDLHSETRNEILMQFANLLLNYDKERAFLMWKNVKEPIINKFIYHTYEINFLIEEGKIAEAKSLIEIYKLRYPSKMYEQQYNHMKLILQIHESNELIDDIEFKLLGNKMKFYKIVAYCNLVYYYHTRGLKDQTKKYIKLLEEENALFTEINKLITNVIEEE
ncbi:MAG: hypothetical protein E7183_05055 [Erysipelotrichaceae bacterium]|nr:hypothetical protein [Erysipelotrichaceae bacterium]